LWFGARLYPGGCGLRGGPVQPEALAERLSGLMAPLAPACCQLLTGLFVGV
jgi:hypothetical protein